MAWIPSPSSASHLSHACFPLFPLSYLQDVYIYTKTTTCTYSSNSDAQCCGTSEIIVIDPTVVKIEADAFKLCTSIIDVSFASATSLATIGASAFEGMGSLALVDMSGAPLLATIGESAFRNCTTLATAKLASATTSIGVTAFTGTALST